MAGATEAVDGASTTISEKTSGKYLTFSLANEEYGVPILNVREIIEVVPIIRIPQTPDFVKGVINIRDRVIPVVDVRLKFGMEEIKYSKRTCIIILELAGRTQMGIIVDSVAEVLDVRPGQIEDASLLDGTLNSDYIVGMAKMDSGIKILLDIDRVLVHDVSIAGRAA